MKEGRLNPESSTVPTTSRGLLRLISCDCKVTATRDSDEKLPTQANKLSVLHVLHHLVRRDMQKFNSPTSRHEDDDDVV